MRISKHLGSLLLGYLCLFGAGKAAQGVDWDYQKQLSRNLLLEASWDIEYHSPENVKISGRLIWRVEGKRRFVDISLDPSTSLWGGDTLPERVTVYSDGQYDAGCVFDRNAFPDFGCEMYIYPTGEDSLRIHRFGFFTIPIRNAEAFLAPPVFERAIQGTERSGAFTDKDRVIKYTLSEFNHSSLLSWESTRNGILSSRFAQLFETEQSVCPQRRSFEAFDKDGKLVRRESLVVTKFDPNPEADFAIQSLENCPSSRIVVNDNGQSHVYQPIRVGIRPTGRDIAPLLLRLSSAYAGEVSHAISVPEATTRRRIFFWPGIVMLGLGIAGWVYRMYYAGR